MRTRPIRFSAIPMNAFMVTVTLVMLTRPPVALYKRLHQSPSLRDRRFGLGDDHVERCWVRDCYLGKHLAIELDAGLGQTVNEFAVAETSFAAGRVDAEDPQPAEITLACAAVAEGECLGTDKRFLDRAEQPAAAAGVALGFFEDAVVFALTRDA